MPVASKMPSTNAGNLWKCNYIKLSPNIGHQMIQNHICLIQNI